MTMAKKGETKLKVDVGAAAPDFTLPTDGGGSVTLSKLKGKAVILYFYPRDDTPGCTTEACSFRDLLPKFGKSGATVIGVSTDSPTKHDKFKAKYELPFTLGADEDHAVANSYGVWVEKNRYGRKYMGTERATFLIDAKGKIAKVWRNVKVQGHAEEVLDALKSA
jgi:peroxiredoxin Q/BCP